MAEDFKTLTPDTTFNPATAFLFGADSQSATDPSIYPGSTIFNALLALANTWTAKQTLSGAGLTFSGNISAAAWTTTGLKLISSAATLTDTSSSGTVADSRTHVIGGDTIAASSATTFTDYFTAFISEPTAGSNVTMTRKWGLGITGNLRVSGVIASTFTNVNIEFATGSFIVRRTDTGTAQFAISATSRTASVAADGTIGFTSANGNATAAIDTSLARESANFMGSPGSVRIMNATAIPAGGTAGAGYKFSSTANFGIFFGSGAPTLAAAKGSLYLRSDGSGIADRAYINTDGSTTWTNLVTAA